MKYQCDHSDTGICEKCFDDREEWTRHCEHRVDGVLGICKPCREFYEGVGEAYNILWRMFKSSMDRQSCNWDVPKEEMLQRILNKIDDEMDGYGKQGD